jgi:hypothetical protein
VSAVSELDLTQAKADLRTYFMRDAYTIPRSVMVEDGGGGFTLSGAASASGYGGLQRNSGRQQDGEIVYQRGDYTLWVATDADILLTDRVIVIGSRTYRIVWLPPVGAGDAARRIGLDEVGA